jgi:hypothetical protein
LRSTAPTFLLAGECNLRKSLISVAAGSPSSPANPRAANAWRHPLSVATNAAAQRRMPEYRQALFVFNCQRADVTHPGLMVRDGAMRLLTMRI